MGNSVSSNNNNNKNMKLDKNKELIYDDSIFNNILEISNELINTYRKDFLNPNFCNSIAYVYQNKLEELDIKVVREINQQINKKNDNKEIRLLLKYNPNDDDLFFANSFKSKLEEYFWQKNIEYKKELFNKNELNINFDNITSYMKFKPKYINPKHVNKLLTIFDEKNMVGGKNKKFNINNYSKTLNNEFNKLIKKDSKKKNNSNSVKNQNENTENKDENNNDNQENNNENQENNNNTNNNILNKNTKNVNNKNIKDKTKDNSKEKDKDKNNSKNNTKNKTKDNIKDNTKDNSKNNSKENSKNKINSKDKINMTNNKNIDSSNESSKIKNKDNSMKKNIKVMNKDNKNDKIINNKNNVSKNNNNLNKKNNENKDNQENNLLNKENLKKINNKTNQIINKVVNNRNKQFKYFVPKTYESPYDFCSKSEKCLLSKKQICQAITENFVIKSNIIAAILTTIPQKVKTNNGNIRYEGGICYQKFLNLNRCYVCVPYNYKEIKEKMLSENKISSDVLKTILEKSDFLYENSCRDNGGYFLKLTEKERLIFVNKYNYSNQQKEMNPSSKYNTFYIECLKKLKKNYFESLNFLVTILETMKSNLYIDNENLNKISLKTKEVIDNMYNLCNYYYIFAVIALINGDLSEEDNNNKSNRLEKSFEKIIN